MSLQQGITKVETPITTEIKYGNAIITLNNKSLTIPSSTSIDTVNAIKQFVDHVYNTGLNDGFQISVNKTNTDPL